MRYILTTNGQVELVEATESGEILNSRGFGFGSLYFQLKNNKVTFYSADSETPYRNDLWTVDLPVKINNEVYSDPSEVSAALGGLMSDSYQEQIDEVKEDLSTEVARAQSAEATLTANLNNEIARAQAEEASLQTAIEAEETARISADGQLSTSIQNEAQRALNAESDLSDRIDAEASRAQGVESNLQSQINAEATARQNADAAITVNITALSGAIDTEVARATTEGASHQNQINAHTTSINNLIASDEAQDVNIAVISATMVTASELNQFYTKLETNALLADKADKASAFTSAEYNSQTKRISFKNANNQVVGEIDATPFIKDGMIDSVQIVNNNLVITFNTDAGKEDISVPLTGIFDPSNYYDKASVDSLLSSKANTATTYTKTEVDNKVTAATADMATKTWVGNQGYLTQHQDISGKQDVSGMTAYTQNTSFTAHTGNSNVHVTSAEKISWNAKLDASAYTPTDLSGYYTKVETDGLLDEKLDASAYTPTDLSNYYNKSEVDNKVTAATSTKQDTLVSGTNIKTINNVSLLGSGNITIEGGGGTVDAYTKAESDAKYQTITGFTAHTADTNVHVTSNEKATWNAKSDFSGSYNDLSNKPTIPTVPTSNTAFTNDAGYITSSALNGYATQGWVQNQGYLTSHQDISGKQDVSGMTAYTSNAAFTAHTGNSNVHVTSAEKTSWNNKLDASAYTPSDLSNYYNKTESDGKYATITNLNSHTGNSNVHVTSAEKTAWNNKSNFSGSYNDLTNKPTIPTIWTGTQAEFDAITTKDPNTLYLVS